ncbi:MAG: single-stranded DNA-binding protein [Saprospiraceae bacterium]|nr:single-stranded DNA-binding protein [Saprospiraceae bacterium]
MVNKATLLGRVGRDTEVRRLENGTPVGKFSLATNESYKDNNGEWQELTEWHEIVVWRGSAEYAEKNIKKGDLVYVEGKITHRKYTDKNNIERTATEIVATQARVLAKQGQGGSGRENSFPTQESPYAASNRTTPTPTYTPATAPQQPVDFEVAPTHNMSDAPILDGGNDLPF